MSDYLENLFSLRGRVAVVTGAARGNGRALAEALGRAGARVALVDLLPDVEQTASALAAEGVEAAAFVTDITDPGQRESLRSLVADRFGAADILVNNAGVSFSHQGLDYPDDLWNKTYNVNLLAPFKLSCLFGQMMKTARRGSIINITSLNAELAFPDNPAYVAFKGALRQLTKSLALDLGPFGIRANNIGPGYFHTQMTDGSFKDPVRNAQRSARTILGRWGKSEDLAGLAIFLASDASSYVTGQDIYIDGGWMIKGL
jgi:NAD(P)-dependent dehydrogenase (short-subunit alcohol dehydrogenase family)